MQDLPSKSIFVKAALRVDLPAGGSKGGLVRGGLIRRGDEHDYRLFCRPPGWTSGFLLEIGAIRLNGIQLVLFYENSH